MPNYNEKENLERGVLDEVNNYLSGVGYKWEVIISDDGSTDGSRQLAEKYTADHKGFRVLPNPHGGKAAAVWAGIKAAKGEIVLFSDMDQSTPLKEVEKLLPFYEQGYDVVFGSRGKMRENFPLSRQILSWGFRHFRQLFLLPKVVDTQAGFKSFKRSVALEIFPLLEAINRAGEVKGWSVSAFDVELLFIAQKRGYKLKEVEVEWRDRDISLGKKKNFMTESVDMLKQILRVTRNNLLGKYNQAE
jgi:glycosyltransferase involved in cell wall biosynthesis